MGCGTAPDALAGGQGKEDLGRRQARQGSHEEAAFQLYRAVNKEARGNCNLLLQYGAWLMLQGKLEMGTRLWHQIPQQFIFKPSDKALQEYSQATEPAHYVVFLIPLGNTQKKPPCSSFLSYFLIVSGLSVLWRWVLVY